MKDVLTERKVFVTGILLGVFVLLVVFFQPVSWEVEPELVVNPSGNVPLSAILRAKTSKKMRLIIEIREGENKRVVTSTIRDEEHEIAVLNFKPDREYTINIKARSSLGREIKYNRSLSFVTSSLPDDFPQIDIKELKPERMEEGVTVFSVTRWDMKGIDNTYGLIVGVDNTGEIVWYYQNRESAIVEVEFLQNGNIAFVAESAYAMEIDKLGNVIREWNTKMNKKEGGKNVVKVDTDAFHHEFSELSSGNFITLSNALRQVKDFPGEGEMVDDVVVEFDRSGKVLNKWSLIDILDPMRISYDSREPFWGKKIYGKDNTNDWGHSNSLQYIEEDESFIVSLRHQDAVVKFNRQGELKWILGDHYGWREPWSKFLLEPIGDTQWSYHQHAAKIISNGNLLLFDNGNGRAISPLPKVSAEQAYSRAVEYKIDEGKMTVEQVWSYGGEGSEKFYSPFLSEADELKETNNVLITDGGHVNDEKGAQTNKLFAGNHWARIFEVTKESVPDKVFELVVGDPERRAMNGGWSVYRSERVKDFFG